MKFREIRASARIWSKMRVVIQRVKRASVEVHGETAGTISHGLVVFLCAMQDDSTEDWEYIIKKVPGLRIFADDDGKFNRSLIDVDGEILLISQFTLAAQTKKGRRPYFADAAEPETARNSLEIVAKTWLDMGIKVEQGIFGAMMDVKLVNDGPVTIWIDSKNRE